MIDRWPLTLKVAIRTVIRHRRRSLITASSVAFGFWLAASFSGVANYSYVSMIDNSATMGFGHVTVIQKEFLDQPSLKKTINAPPELVNEIKKIPGVRSVTPRIMGQGMVATASRSIAVQFIAFDPDREEKVDNLLIKSIVDGAVMTSSDELRAIVGKDIAKKLNLAIGKKFVYTTTGIDGEMTSQLMRVAGIFSAGAEEIDGYLIGLPLDSARKALGYRSDQATMLAIVLDDNRQSEAIKNRINQLPYFLQSSSEVAEDWRTTQPDLAAFVAMDEGSMRVFIGFVVVLVALAVLNTMLMSVLERGREFGVMLAIGTSPISLVKMIMAESGLIGGMGIIIGTLLFLPLHYYLSRVGIDIKDLYSEEITAGGAVFDTTLRSTIFLDQMAFITIGLLALTVGATLYPAVKAARTVPMDSIRGLK